MNKKLFTFFLSLVIVFAFNVSVFADNEENNDSQNDSVPDITSIDTSSPAQVVVDITQLLNQQAVDNSVDNIEDKGANDPDLVTVVDPQLVSVEVTKQAITANNTTGFKSVLLSILGDYETTVTDYTYQQSNYSYLSHSINIERDWAWICSCGVFALLLFCTFRTIGGICARF